MNWQSLELERGKKKGMLCFKHCRIPTQFCVCQLQHTLHFIREYGDITSNFLRNEDQLHDIKLHLIKNSYSSK